MKKARIPVLIGFFVAVLVLVPVSLWTRYQQADSAATVKQAVLAGMTAEVEELERLKLSAQQEQQRLEIERLKDKKNAIPFTRNVKSAVFVGFSFAGCLSLLIVSVAVYKKKTVHTLKLKSAEIPILHRDLSKLAPEVSTGLVLAEQLEARAPEKAFLLYERMAQLNTAQIQAIVGRKGAITGRTIAEHEHPAALPPAPIVVPSFSDLLTSGEIAPGKPLIFGYRKQDGSPEKGRIAEQYSCVIIGLSGFGKTTFLAYNIASAVYVERAVFDVLDLHYPHRESLGSVLGELVNTEFVTITSNPIFLPDVISEYKAELKRRLAQPDTVHAPRILVVDEHERWCKNSELVKLEMDIVNEGRKVGMYLYITSKSAKADKIGDSALRDNCVTSYVFKTKPQNAKTFYQDKEKEQLVKELKEPGEAVFTNMKDDSMLVKVPYAQPEDMHRVCQMVSAGNTIRVSGPQPPAQPIGSRPIRVQPDPDIDSFFDTMNAPQPTGAPIMPDTTQHTGTGPDATQSNVIDIDSKRHHAPECMHEQDILTALRALCETRPDGMSKNAWQKQAAQEAGLSFSLLKNVMLSSAPVTPESASKLTAYLRSQTG